MADIRQKSNLFKKKLMHVSFSEKRMSLFCLLTHSGKMLHRFGKFSNGSVGISMFDPFPHTMVQMTFKHNLSGFMKRAFSGVYLY